MPDNWTYDDVMGALRDMDRLGLASMSLDMDKASCQNVEEAAGWIRGAGYRAEIQNAWSRIAVSRG